MRTRPVRPWSTCVTRKACLPLSTTAVICRWLRERKRPRERVEVTATQESVRRNGEWRPLNISESPEQQRAPHVVIPVPVVRPERRMPGCGARSRAGSLRGRQSGLLLRPQSGQADTRGGARRRLSLLRGAATCVLDRRGSRRAPQCMLGTVVPPCGGNGACAPPAAVARGGLRLSECRRACWGLQCLSG